jgi:hypothetical protein
LIPIAKGFPSGIRQRANNTAAANRRFLKSKPPRCAIVWSAQAVRRMNHGVIHWLNCKKKEVLRNVFWNCGGFLVHRDHSKNHLIRSLLDKHQADVACLVKLNTCWKTLPISPWSFARKSVGVGSPPCTFPWLTRVSSQQCHSH